MPAGPRIRGNNAYGLTTDNPLAIGATTLNSAQLALLPAVSSAHAVITLDPLRQFGNPEIVVVTAHAGGATAATIVRGQYGTSARAHPVNTTWVHAPINEDVITIATSGARPTNPYPGLYIHETDTNKLVGFGGVDWAPRDAGGALGYNTNTAGQVITAGPTIVTGTAQSITVGTGRRIKVAAVISQANLTAGSTGYFGEIFKNGAALRRVFITELGSLFTVICVPVIDTPIAGVHTYDLRLTRFTGAGNFNIPSGADLGASILVEDIGAA